MSLRPNVEMQHHRGHVRKTPPAAEPVTAAELRAQLSETAAGLPDAQADALIAESRELIEAMTGLAFVTQAWTLAIDQWPGGSELWWDGMRQMAVSEVRNPNATRALDMPRYPLQGVDGVTVYDEAGAASTVVIADIFDVDTLKMPGRMVLKRGATWPLALRATNAIEVEYSAGFGEPADVPAILKRAVKQVAAYLHAHYGDDCHPGDAIGAARGLLASYVVKRI